ncbi:mechanosensitive ion channel family protein [Paenibacillus sp. JX-17]|uniref:Mechanosensitive ion channel family protein n=1 Tax=Paenibacillus lacisoli TaxID=3064525 RepID=A0ABT9CA88_9BACL|nr:mechanosensitive ion channel family protein [Paenibacillus sp. JX-17]MDO7906171.1 mechanosensitive ion channel family protein [Paenibacillus sp. JX-17]
MFRGYLTSDAGDSAKQTFNEAKKFTDKMWDWLTNGEMWMNFLFICIKIAVVLIITRIFIKIVYKVIDRSLENKVHHRLGGNTRRMNTIAELLKNVTTVVCNFILILLVLSQLGIQLGPLIAGAGVIGLAIGFGAQSLVKDIITGFFIIFEDQFAVGDVIQTGTYKGTVQLIGLRTTRLVSWKGEVHILPNGTIAQVTNFSMSNSLAVVDVPLKAERNVDEAVQLVKHALADLKVQNNYVQEDPEVLGVQSMTTAEFVVRIVVECLPNTRAEVERNIQTEVKKALEQDEAAKQAAAEYAAAREEQDGGN